MSSQHLDTAMPEGSPLLDFSDADQYISLLVSAFLSWVPDYQKNAGKTKDNLSACTECLEGLGTM